MKQFNFRSRKRIGAILIFSGPSGAGKSSICRQIIEEDSRLEFSISCTTRTPRPGEIDGRDYFFINKDRFEQHIESGDFLEYARVHDNYYGTLKSEVLNRIHQGVDVILDIDVQGAMKIKELTVKDEFLSKAIEFIFVSPPDSIELERRLRGRGTEKEDVIHTRLSNAEYEISKWKDYSYLIVNDSLEEARVEFASLIKALRLKTSRLI